MTQTRPTNIPKTICSGPALGIGGGCDSLGPMLIGGPKKFMVGVYIEKCGLWRVYIYSKVNQKTLNIDMMKGWAKACYGFWPFWRDLLYSINHKYFYIHPPYTKMWLSYNMPNK